jgi:hypothetical protein
MTWNYRIFKEKNRVGRRVFVSYNMREAYYNRLGKIDGWTEPLLSKPADSIHDLSTILAMMLCDTLKHNAPLVIEKKGKKEVAVERRENV